jgi:membrane protease YdiL (CAAX protease family)
MGEILASAAFGFLKGFLMRVPERSSTGVSHLHAVITGPLSEELLYRAMLPAINGRPVHRALSAGIFATDHVLSEFRRFGPAMTPGRAVTRFADVFAGGMLYENAYRRSGILGAFLAHAAHNLAVGYGGKVSRAGRAP